MAAVLRLQSHPIIINQSSTLDLTILFTVFKGIYAACVLYVSFISVFKPNLPQVPVRLKEIKLKRHWL
jgi:hypothetical protein